MPGGETVTDVLDDAPAAAPRATVLLAHGAGAPMDAGPMQALTEALVAADFAVRRFEFPYMAARRQGGRRPPPRAETLIPDFAAALDRLLGETSGSLVIGGRSLGGRVAAMLAGTPLDRRVRAVACFGYPFHPPGKPDQLRLAPLEASHLPVLVVQGTRDPFGTREEVGGYRLPPHVTVHWLEDGDHELSPRRASGFTAAGHRAEAARAVAALLAGGSRQ